MARDVMVDYDELEVEAQKDKVGDGLVIMTTLVLILAFFMIQKALADHYNKGMLADKQAEAPAE